MQTMNIFQGLTAAVVRKARWDREENVLTAREELCLVASGVCNFNQELVKCIPGRSLEAIKEQRRSSVYKAIIQELMDGNQSEEERDDAHCPCYLPMLTAHHLRVHAPCHQR